MQRRYKGKVHHTAPGWTINISIAEYLFFSLFFFAVEHLVK